jgi:hypothetical protein
VFGVYAFTMAAIYLGAAVVYLVLEHLYLGGRLF